MNLVETKISPLDLYLPGLEEKLAAIPFAELERPGSPVLEMFRRSGGTGLLVPRESGGLGVDPVEAVRIQRAIASRSPSLGVATTMHHFSVVTLVELAARGSVLEQATLQRIATERLFMASGFSEGQTATSCVLSSRMRITPAAGGVWISGVKKPCSLSLSMDLMAVGALLSREEGGEPELAVLTVAASSPGIQRRPFWSSWVLGAAETDEIVLEEVWVDSDSISWFGDPVKLDKVQARCLVWFEMLIAATYLGIATRLVSEVVRSARGSALERTTLGMEMETSMAALERVAYDLNASGGGVDDESVARALFVRFGVQAALERAVPLAAELLGGMAFITTPEVAYILAASRALAYHPPSRATIAPTLASYLEGQPIVRQGW
jgi:alkylation response protein AidB-like acyl-CoA dehydrogenase